MNIKIIKRAGDVLVFKEDILIARGKFSAESLEWLDAFSESTLSRSEKLALTTLYSGAEALQSLA